MTKTPISTISYNTEPFLKEVLDRWVNAHIVQAYTYIKHKGEDGDKDHIHLRIEPNKSLDQMDLTAQLQEFVKDNKKPLGIRPWRPSKEEDWILYAVHDEQYLKIKYGGGDKGEKLPYNWQDVRCSEHYDVETMFIRAKQKLEHTSANLVKRIQSGESALNILASGENPFVVNAVRRGVMENDYERVVRDFNALNTIVANYDALLQRASLRIRIDGSVYRLVNFVSGEILSEFDECALSCGGTKVHSSGRTDSEFVEVSLFDRTKTEQTNK